VVQHGSVAESLLRGPADLAGRARDVVERLVGGLDAERLQRLQHPVVEKRVGVGETHALHEVGGRVDRVGDDRAGLHEHGAAPADAAHDVEAELGGLVEVDLVLHRLEAADDDGGLVPLPDAQGGLAAAGADLFGEHLVERHLQHGRRGLAVDELPVVVAPAGGPLQRAADGGGDALGAEAEHDRALGQRFLNGGRDARRVDVGRQAVDGVVDRLERAVGLEEEVSGQPESRDLVVDDLEVDDYELAPWHLEFAVHGCRLSRDFLRKA
jgi:hypothetical protein